MGFKVAGSIVTTLLVAANVLLFDVPSSTAQAPVRPEIVNWKQTRKIVDFIRIHGHPDLIELQDQDRIYHWKRIATMTFADGKGGEKDQAFECEVAVRVAVDGPILRVDSKVADAGALAIASIGGFGPSCEKTFGVKETTAGGHAASVR